MYTPIINSIAVIFSSWYVNMIVDEIADCCIQLLIMKDGDMIVNCRCCRAVVIGSAVTLIGAQLLLFPVLSVCGPAS